MGKAEPLTNWLNRNSKILYLLSVLLMIPAFFINLGVLPLFADEPIRALVTLEMEIRDNFIIPTINGAYYYNKPPVYNWLLYLFFKLTGSYSEFVIRLPSVLFLFVFGGTIYATSKIYVGRKAAFFAAVFTMTCGRILIYASLLGHIDLFYSWMTYSAIFSIYHFYRKDAYWLLFLVSYGIAAAGFLTKGFPSLLFQGITLFVLVLLERSLKPLLKKEHIAGMILFAALLGVYFYLYHQEQSLLVYFETLWTESTKRTAASKGIGETILHLFIFPFETAYHLLPWSLLLIVVLRRTFWQVIRENKFLLFCLLSLLGNISVYWLSPDTLPRYIFMLIPLIFLLLAKGYFVFAESMNKSTAKRIKVLDVIWISITSLITLAMLAPLFIRDEIPVDQLVLKSLVLFVVSALLFTAMIYSKRQRLILFVMVVLVFRIGFNWFIIPVRVQNFPHQKHKEYALKVAEHVGDNVVKLYKWTPLNYNISYYISRENRKIIRRDLTGSVDHDSATFYIMSDYYLSSEKGDALNEENALYKFETRYESTPLYLMKLYGKRE